ncbi:MAG: Ig-like domain-containing protein, partial [Oscillospiraceae bacterium]|nr:Ig-like domain-containing protein [Oscillospiraceae bacterium]
MDRSTILLDADVTYQWEQKESTLHHDVDQDGDTDEDDVQALLDYLTGTVDGTALDLDAGEMDEAEGISSYDAYLLLQAIQAEGIVEDGVVPANSSRRVDVTIALTGETKEALDALFTSGAYIEGFTYATCETVTDENESLAHEHSIPLLGFYGSWTDPSMFDNTSYIDTLYGTDKIPYSTYTNTNYMTVRYAGTEAKFAGNPYMVEEVFPADRLAFNSGNSFERIAYNLIRSAGTTGFAVTRLDKVGGDVTGILSASVTGNDVVGQWYYTNQATWQNTATRFYSVNKTGASFGLADGDVFRIGYYAIPEYYGMLASDDMTAADAGVLGDSGFRALLMSNLLGRGAFVGYDFTVDNVDPTITEASLSGNEISVTASDNLNLAYVAVLSLDGTVKYAEAAPGTDSYTISFDAAEAIANANGYVAVFAADYAGNEVAKAVKVNDNSHVEKTVYVLTDTLTAGDEYLIVDRNTAGSGHGLAYTPPTNVNATTANVLVYNPNVKAGTADTGNKPYIEAADAAATGIWTAGSGITLTNVNGTKTWYMGRSRQNALTIGTEPNNRNWTYDGTNSRLASGTRYLSYANNTFSLSASTNYKIYLYVKTTISYEVDPYSVDGVTVTPATLSLYKGNEADLVAKVTPLTAEDRTVTWSSSNENVAAVDQNGHVVAAGKGTATIRATSAADSIKFGECEVTVEAINKELSAIIWDEEGKVFFSTFNASGLPTWTKRHDDGGDTYLTSAMMASTTALYAATNDLSTSHIYTVDRTSYALTDLGENFAVPFGMAPAGSSFGSGYYVYAFAKYIIFGNLEPEEDEELGTFCGFPYGLLDLSTTSVGDA